MRKRSLFTWLVLGNIVVLSVALVVLGLALDRLLQQRATTMLTDRLVAQAKQVNAATTGLAADRTQDIVRALGSASGTRITIVRRDGVVLADSDHDPSTMENHATRSEVAAAIAGKTGVAQRVSGTLGTPFLYVAVPLAPDRVVRTAVPAAEVESQRRAVRATIAVVFGALLVVATGISSIVARSVTRPLRRMGERVAALATESEQISVDPSGPREAAQLGTAINEMAADIAALVDRLRAETTLREEILTSMSEGVILADRTGATIYANPAARAWLGDKATMPASVEKNGVAEMTLHHPERRDIRSVSIELDDGRWLIVIQDVTVSKRVEEMRRDFVANASHELKTPIGAIRATAETLAVAANDDPASVERFSRMLVHESRRLTMLVDDLLDLARLESASSERAPVALAEVVRLELERLTPAASQKGLTIETDVDPTAIVDATARDLRLAVGNLLDNAIRYTERGAIRVEVRNTGGRAVVRVTDQGSGIAAKHLPRIFERFYRVDEARSRLTGGTGLGLSIVRHVAESLGGTVRVDSELGAGSSFTVTLPLAATVAATDV